MAPTLETLIVALTQRIVENTAALEAWRAELAGDPKNPSYPVLLRAIGAAFPNQSFSCSELVEACDSNKPTVDALREAIVAAARAVNSYSLGKLFQRIEGYDLGGLRVIRGKRGNEGVTWRVTPSVTMKKSIVTSVVTAVVPARHDSPSSMRKTAE